MVTEASVRLLDIIQPSARLYFNFGSQNEIRNAKCLKFLTFRQKRMFIVLLLSALVIKFHMHHKLMEDVKDCYWILNYYAKQRSLIF